MMSRTALIALLSAVSATLTLGAAPALAAPPPAPGRAAPTKPAVSAAEWTRLLAAYVKASPDGVNRFDYGALKASKTDMAALDAYIASFARRDLADTSQQAFADWANLYNAVTVRYIAQKYPLKSIRDGYITGPWKKIMVTAGGREISLNDIEHVILRPTFKDARVHYAINCASYGCPNLPQKAWEAASLDAELDAAARAYINHPRGVTVTAKGLQLSSIYDWFKADFGADDAALLAHLTKYAAPELAAKLKTAGKARKYTYDWALNDVPAKPLKAGK
jgi:Protein of unknown function, DUF547